MNKPPFDCEYEKDCRSMGVSIPEECVTYCKVYKEEMEYKERGLKDHEIAELVNSINNAFYSYYGRIGQRPHSCYREIISRAVNEYLQNKGLKLDDETNGQNY